MQTSPLIPVIVLNWNGIDDTEMCVQHLLQQSYQGLKIFLADNGSNDEDVNRLELLKMKHPDIELILFEENLGFTKAHNRIITKILSFEDCPPYILLLNNDAFADVNWAQELIASATRNDADIVSSKMINYFARNEIDNVGHRILNTAEIIPQGTGDAPTSYEKELTNVGACAGAALYSTNMLRAIGVFDEYFETGYEDAELGARATVLGYRSMFNPKAIVFHKISRSIAKIRDFNYVLKTQLNIFYTYFKLMPWLVILVNMPFIVFKYMTVLLINLIFGRWFFFRVMRTAISRSLTTERHIIMEARRRFQKCNKPISSLKILSKMEFFLWFDIKRFYKHMVKGEKTQFEKVSKN